MTTADSHAQIEGPAGTAAVTRDAWIRPFRLEVERIENVIRHVTRPRREFNVRSTARPRRRSGRARRSTRRAATRSSRAGPAGSDGPGRPQPSSNPPHRPLHRITRRGAQPHAKKENSMTNDAPSAPTKPPRLIDTFWSKSDAADQLGICTRTLEIMEKRGTGPRAIRLGARVLFDPDEVRAWLVENRGALTEKPRRGRPKKIRN